MSESPTLAPSPSRRDQDKFPYLQFAILSLVRIAEPIAITSILPYCWYFIQRFDAAREEHAALDAGLLVGAFSAAEAVSSIFWGIYSDRIGRKKVLIIGTAGTTISMLIFGFSRSLWLALFGRVLGGLLNGNVGIIQTIASDLVTRKSHRSLGYSIPPFVWYIGTTIGPLIGGFLADPAENFPSIFSPTGLFGQFPYLLPNLFCAGLLLISMILAHFFLVDTRTPKEDAAGEGFGTPKETTSLVAAARVVSPTSAGNDTGSYGTFDRAQATLTPTNTGSSGSSASSVTLVDPKGDTAFVKPVLMVLLAVCIYTYHTMAWDYLMPIFFQDDRTGQRSRAHNPFAGGLGLSVQDVGFVLGISGIIAAVVQGIIYPIMERLLGPWPLLFLVTICHPIAYFLVPYLVSVPQEWLFFGIYACVILRNLCSIIAYPILMGLLNDFCPQKKYRGRVNGAAASGSALFRTLASPMCGYLYGLGTTVRFTGLAWWASGLVALVGTVQFAWIERPKDKVSDDVESAFPWIKSDVNEGEVLLDNTDAAEGYCKDQIEGMTITIVEVAESQTED